MGGLDSEGLATNAKVPLDLLINLGDHIVGGGGPNGEMYCTVGSSPFMGAGTPPCQRIVPGSVKEFQ